MKIWKLFKVSLRSWFLSKNKVAVDVNHNILLFGLLLSHKPKKILEIGIGTSLVSNTILDAIDYNQSGELTCIDCLDYNNFMEPYLVRAIKNKLLKPLKINIKKNVPSYIKKLKKRGAIIIAPIDEGDFTINYKGELFDFIISDGDHFNAGNWVDKTFSLLNKDGIILFHDTNQPDVFPNLLKIIKFVKDNNYFHYHFTKKSLASERSDRGFLWS